MLGRLLLVLVQLVFGWFVALEIVKNIPTMGRLDIFLLAAVFALLSWSFGLLAASMLKDVARPAPSALLFSFAVAVIFASLSVVPDVQRAVMSVAGHVDLRIYPLLGSVIGYAIHS